MFASILNSQNEKNSFLPEMYLGSKHYSSTFDQKPLIVLIEGFIRLYLLKSILRQKYIRWLVRDKKLAGFFKNIKNACFFILAVSILLHLPTLQILQCLDLNVCFYICSFVIEIEIDWRKQAESKESRDKMK